MKGIVQNSLRVRARKTMLLLTALASCCLTGCREDGGDSEPTGRQPVAVKLALSVAKHQAPGDTRMLPDNIKGSASNVEFLYLRAFIGTGDQVTKDETYEATSTVNPLNLVKTPTDAGFFTSSCDFVEKVNKLLVYGRDKTTGTDPEKGALVANLAVTAQPADISFRLKPIKTRAQYGEQTIPQQLAAYLTTIANTSVGEGENKKTWKAYADDESMNATLRLLYKNFTNQLSNEVGEVLPGSAANVKAWVTELWTQLNALTDLTGDDASMKDAIKTAIEEKLTVNPKDWKQEVKTAWDGFPASLYLPDGAAVVRWNGTAFVPETQTTTIADINNIERFTYPAKIYYYGNSPTCVSPNDLSENFTSKGKWQKASDTDTEAVLSGFDKAAVDASTKTVAMRDPLQYGVAQLVVKLNKTATTLLDSKNNPITVGTQNFKLTGIIVGGQLPVGFDFTPETLYPSYTETDMSFIYDSQVNTNGTDNYFYLSTAEPDNTKSVQTLVLQSYERRNLKLVLEFENNSGSSFKGYNGTVYNGTKFYLVGEVKYNDNEGTDSGLPDEIKNRVFTQDRTTTITVTVNSLAKAYNVLPNLLSPRLEMGIELTPQWEEATPTDVIL